jgi:hypothetical protein
MDLAIIDTDESTLESSVYVYRRCMKAENSLKGYNYYVEPFQIPIYFSERAIYVWIQSTCPRVHVYSG